MEEDLQVAIVGCGRVAQHIKQFFISGISGVNVSMVCDVVQEKADMLSDELGAEAVYELGTILHNAKIHTVLILTESGNHGEHARMALEAGKHVIVEKPIALRPQEVLDNMKLAAEKDLMYAEIKQNRFNPAIVKLKETYDQKKFGKIVMASIRLVWCRYQEYYEDGWHGTWAMDGGVINQQAIHHIDALRWICGPVKEVVSAQTNALNNLEAEDTTVALVRFKSGALGVIEATTAARPDDKEASLMIVGENGTAEVGGVALNQITRWEIKGDDAEKVMMEHSQEVPNGYGLSHGPLLEEIFSRLKAGNIEPPITAEDALETLSFVHALYKSAEDHAWVHLDEAPSSKYLGRSL
ncbi:MAG: Gfo/Idh/MocA family oxidoreductase [Parcubacteria group bacterium]|nr:Gfo/Idh/MocA family oxidoreductase [Parcubacteria group bacterium]